MKLLLLLLNAGKLGKLLFSGGTMLLSVFTYGLIFGWQYALGFVVLLLAHEMGHYLAAQQRGLNVGLPTFIPFVGAWIEMKEMPHDAETEAYVGFAGPLVGSVASLACYYLARHYDSNLLLAVSYSGFFLNLFNLIPISPFDGGRITAVISPKLWLVGAPMLVALFFYRPSPLLILMAILAAPQVIKAWRFNPNAEEHAAYYRVNAQDRVTYAIYYLALAAFLAIMSNDVHQLLESARYN